MQTSEEICCLHTLCKCFATECSWVEAFRLFRENAVTLHACSVCFSGIWLGKLDGFGQI